MFLIITYSTFKLITKIYWILEHRLQIFRLHTQQQREHSEQTGL